MAQARHRQGTSKAQARHKQGTSNAQARHRQGSSRAAQAKHKQSGTSIAQARHRQGTSEAQAMHKQSRGRAQARHRQSTSRVFPIGLTLALGAATALLAFIGDALFPISNPIGTVATRNLSQNVYVKK